MAEAKAKANKRRQRQDKKAIDEAIKVNALYEGITQNNVGAENKYKGKMLFGNGYCFYNIDKTLFFLGTAYVNLMAGYVADGVTAYFF